MEGSTPYATLREPCFGFGVYIRTFSETAEMTAETAMPAAMIPKRLVGYS